MILLKVVVVILVGLSMTGLIYGIWKEFGHVILKGPMQRILFFAIPSFIESKSPQIIEEKPKPPPSPNKAVVDMVCDLLIMNKDWVISDYHADHSAGVSIWIANGHQSVGLRLGGEKSKPHRDSDSPLDQLNLTQEERLEIWDTFKATQTKTFGAAELSAAIIRRYGTEEDIIFLDKTKDLLERSREIYHDNVISQLPRYGGNHDRIEYQQVD